MGKDPKSHPMNELAQILSDENEIAELNAADASEDGENDNAEEHVLASKNLQDLLLNQTHADLQDQSKRLDEAFAQNLHDVEECDTHGVEIDELDLLEELVSELKTNSDNEKMNAPELDNSPLYDGAAVTVGTIMLLLALYTSKFGVSLDALKYLLAIINLCLPGGQKLCDNVHAYKKLFTSLKQPACEVSLLLFILFTTHSRQKCPLLYQWKLSKRSDGSWGHIVLLRTVNCRPAENSIQKAWLL